MKEFLYEYYSSTEKNQKDYSKLLYAIEKNYTEFTFKLVVAGENPNYQSSKKNPTPFLLAVYKEDEKLVSTMITRGADVNLKAYSPSSSSVTLSPLMVAVIENKSANITKILCDSGAIYIENSFNMWDHDHPLVRAININDPTKVRIIANTYSDEYLKRVDWTGGSLLTSFWSKPLSKTYKADTVEISQYFIEHGLLIETEKESALTAAINHGNQDLFYYLLSIGANINHIPMHKNYDYILGLNPLFAAIDYYVNRTKDDKDCLIDGFYAPRLEFLTKLLEEGVQIDFHLTSTSASKNSEYCYSPLTYSVEKKLNDVVSLLIQYGADVNMPDYTKRTPLIYAVQANNLNFVQLLLSAGAHPSKADKYSRTPIDIAYSSGYSEILKALIEAESNLFD